MRRPTVFCFLAASALCFAPNALFADAFYYNAPVNAGPANSTLYGLNDTGLAVGADYSSGTPTPYTYTYPAGVITSLPSLAPAVPNGVNDAGVIVGTYTGTLGADPFVYSSNTLTQLKEPGNAFFVYGQGINTGGTVVGFYVDASSIQHGLIYPPPATGSIPQQSDFSVDALSTQLNGINSSNVIAGTAMVQVQTQLGPTTVTEGFYGTKGSYTAFTFNGFATYAQGINDNGLIAGYYQNGNIYEGFVYDTITQSFVNTKGISFSADGTQIFGINDANDIVGDYNSATTPQAFIAYPSAMTTPEPATYVVALPLFALLFLARYRGRRGRTPQVS